MRMVLTFILSFLAAFLLDLMPLPSWINWLRPEWVLLVVVFWSLVLPHRFGVGIAFIVGIIMDLLNSSLLGEHALIMVLISYFTVKFYIRIRLFPIWQQAVIIFMFSFFSQCLQLWIQGVVGQLPTSLYFWSLFWLPSLTAALLWPWIFAILKTYRRSYRVLY